MSSDDTNSEANGGKKKKFDLKPTQAAASGMAAITAAVLGSELGWAGSVAGAGIASVFTTLASSFYQQTLDRTKQSVKEKVVARTAPYPRGPGGTQRPTPQRPGTQRPSPQGPPSYAAGQRPQHGVRQPLPPRPAPVQAPGQQVRPAAQPTQPPQKTDVNTGDQTRRTFAAIDPSTVQLNNPQFAKTQVVNPALLPTQAMPQQPGSPADAATQVIAPAQQQAKRKLPWKPIVLLSALAMLFGLVGLTGIELLNGGNPVLGHGKGVTVFGDGNSGGGSNSGDENNQAPAGTSTTPEQDQPSEAPATSTTDEPQDTTTTEAPETTTPQKPTTTQPKNQGGVAPTTTR